MIEAARFIEAARARGFDWYAGVPCSYLTPFINFVSQDRSLHYLAAANEGDAVAMMAGVALAGRRGVTMMQNSGLGNAVSPLTSLTWTFRLPQLLIVTWRGQPGVPDEPQHALMGPITPAMLDAMEIPWETFPVEPEAVAPALDRAVAHMDATGRPYALVMQKGSVAPYPLPPAVHQRDYDSSTVPVVSTGYWAQSSRGDALRTIIVNTDPASTVVLASTGYCARELYAIEDRPNHFYMVGSMGCVTSCALGLALARPDLRIVAVDGDGAALMRMGAFATLGKYGPANLTHVLLDNGMHESTGGQSTVSNTMNFGFVASACGYASARNSDDLAEITRLLGVDAQIGPRFLCLRIQPGVPIDLPRPTISPVDVADRLMRHIGARL